MTEYVTEPGGRVPVAATSDLVVVGSTFSALFFGVVSFAEGRMLRWNVAHRN